MVASSLYFFMVGGVTWGNYSGRGFNQGVLEMFIRSLRMVGQPWLGRALLSSATAGS